MNWNQFRDANRQYIPYEPEDASEYQCEIHTMYSDYAEADRVLGKVGNDLAGALTQTNAGMSSSSGAPRFHVVHEGRLTGKQFKNYILAVAQNGAQLYEAFARGAPPYLGPVTVASGETGASLVAPDVAKQPPDKCDMMAVILKVAAMRGAAGTEAQFYARHRHSLAKAIEFSSLLAMRCDDANAAMLLTHVESFKSLANSDVATLMRKLQSGMTKSSIQLIDSKWRAVLADIQPLLCDPDLPLRLHLARDIYSDAQKSGGIAAPNTVTPQESRVPAVEEARPVAASADAKAASPTSIHSPVRPASSRTWWDRLLYGTKGKSRPE